MASQRTAQALARLADLTPRQIAGEICIYTNTHITVLEPGS